eukprot:611102-Pleurochrysis_carterae.AAC.2
MVAQSMRWAIFRSCVVPATAKFTAGLTGGGLKSTRGAAAGLGPRVLRASVASWTLLLQEARARPC